MNSSPPDGRIQPLDPVVANQIAAGEVVERPSSVVKELVENSLDAGATQITIRLQDGGRTGIQIIDNGVGMGPADAKLAFVRHATSKLVSADELMKVRSYGFRGEALASILAVANVVLRTRRADDELGIQLSGGGSCTLAERAVACPVGTDLRIDDLFFNMPARQKFLRTAATELGHTIRLVDAVALARPELRLELTNNGRKIALYPATDDLAERAEAVFGEQIAPHLHGFSGDEDYGVDGRLSSPEMHHGSATSLVFLVDGRPVRDRTLQHAVVQAYGPLLERRRFPVGVVRLRCPPGTVDVNVHPAKTEVRFVSSQAVHRAVGRAVRAMLMATPWLQRAVVGEGSTPYRVQPELAHSPVASAGVASHSPGVTFAGARWRQLQLPAQGGAVKARPSVQDRLPSSSSPLPSSSSPSPSPSPSSPPRVAAITSPASSAASSPWGAMQGWRYIGQMARRFLIFDDGVALVLVDQHAAHECALHARFMAATRTDGIASQRMLIPRVVPLGPDAAAALLQASDLTGSLGFELAAAAERAVMVRAFPDVLRPNQVDAEIRRLAALVCSDQQTQSRPSQVQQTSQLQQAAASLACHAAISAGETVTAQWVQDLVADLATVDMAVYQPHGRQVIARLTLDQIGGLFDLA